MFTKEEKTVATAPKPHSKRLKILTTCAVLCGNLTFGCGLNFFSPALEHFRIKFDSTIDSISVVFTIQLLGACVGALSSGFIYNYINRQLGVIFSLAGVATALYITPHCTNQTQFFLIGGFLGYFLGTYSASQVVWIIEIWQEKAGPLIQAQHFCFALGSNIPSLIVAPFVSDMAKTDDDSLISKFLSANLATNGTKQYDSQVYIPFTIGGALCTVAMCFQIFLFIFYRYYVPPLYISESSDGNGNGTEKPMENTADFPKQPLEMEIQNDSSKGLGRFNINWPKLRLIILTGAFLGAYQGMEICTMQFIPTFGQYSDLRLSESDAAFVLTGITAASAVGRFLGIFIIMKVPPIPMLYGNLTLILSGNIILLVWAKNHITMFWVACCLLGAGFSTMYASFSAFMEKHLIFSNAIASFMICCGSLFAAIYPLIVGKAIEDKVVVLTYTNFFSISICLISLTFASLFTFRNKTRIA